MKLQSFLSQVDQERVVAAIRAVEERTRGEIRVHASNRAVDDAQGEAARQFERLGMTATAERNGVLIYLAPRSQRFAILGDTGIHEKCGPDFWKQVADAMEHDFREGRFTEGLLRGIAVAGDALARFFPRTVAADVNELPDQVSED
jgi:uncharacterized membrane protein